MVSRSISSSVVCFAILGLLSACSGGSGGGSSTDGKGALDPAQFVKPGAVGAFSITKEATLGKYGEVPIDMQLSNKHCASQDFAWDPRLQVGDQFVETEYSATGDGASSSKSTSTIQSLDATHLSRLLTISDISVTPAIASIPSSVQVQIDCTLAPNDVSCPTKFIGWTPTDELTQNSKWCNISSQNTDSVTTGTVALGSFTTASGRTVSAQRIRSVVSNVKIECQIGDAPATDVGEGTVEEDNIVSQQAVSYSPGICNPALTLYRLRTVKLKSGVILQMHKDEVLSAPAR